MLVLELSPGLLDEDDAPIPPPAIRPMPVPTRAVINRLKTPVLVFQSMPAFTPQPYPRKRPISTEASTAGVDSLQGGSFFFSGVPPLPPPPFPPVGGDEGGGVQLLGSGGGTQVVSVFASP